MLSDPIFILSVIGMSLCIIFWMKDAIKSSKEENFITKNISSVATIFGLMMLYSIFINAGDLGIILFIGSIVAFLVLMVGIIIGNSSIIQTSRGYFIPIFLIFVLRTFIYEPYQIPSGSMLPGLQKGDFLVVNKNSYGLKVNRTGKSSVIKNDPEYGDVVVFIPPHNPVPYVKRLIGMPGDSVRIINKQIFINGKAISREFIETETTTITKRYRDSSGNITTREMDVTIDLYLEEHGNKRYITRNIRGENIQYPSEWTIPSNHYFVMGDNRDNSNDSTKDVGFVPRDNFFGEADYLFMTWECWTCMPYFSRVGKIN